MKKTLLFTILLFLLSISGKSQNLTIVYNNVFEPTCFGMCDGNFEIQVEGGIAPYNIELVNWGTTPDFQPNDSTFIYQGLCPGYYEAIVRDVFGDSLYYSFDLIEPMELQASVTSVVNSSCNNTCDGMATVSANGGTLFGSDYSYTWNNGAIGDVSSNLCAGTYSCVIMDDNGCQITVFATLSEPTPITISLSSGPDCGNSNVGCSGWASVQLTGGTFPVSYNWSNGSTSQNVWGLCPGDYGLSVVDANGCQASDSITIDSVASPIEIMIDTLVHSSCADGWVEVIVNGGVGQLDISWLHGATDPFLWGLNPGWYGVEVFDEIGCYDSIMFEVQDLGSANCSHISGTVFLDDNLDCNHNNWSDLVLSGKMIQADPTPGLDGDEFYSITDWGGMYTFDIPFGTYEIKQVNDVNYGDHCAGNGGILSVTTSSGNPFSDNNDFYDTLTMNINARVWVYSSAIRPGFTNTFYVNIDNIGGNLASGTLQVVYPSSQLSYSSANPTPNNINGDTLFWDVANLTNQDQTFVIYGVGNNISINEHVLLCADIITNENDIDGSNNHICHDVLVTGSYDPNDKSVSPAGDIALQDQYLNYLIRFQNTGTDTAFNVVIADTISSKLDLETFEVLENSHPMQVELNGNVIKFSFSDILLPDSNVNEPASHGYIQYRIKQASGNQVGDEITNTAYIYFDFNEAIITNTTSSLITVPSTVYEWADFELNVYPNPFRNEINVRSDNRIDAVKLIDNLGRIVHSKTLNAYNYQFSTEELSKGIYTLEILSNGQLKREKIMKQ